MVAIRILVLLGLAAAAPVADLQRRDIAAVETDLKTVSEAMKSLTAAMDAYPGGLIAAIKLRAPQAALEAALAKATTTYKAEPEKMSDADGQKGVDWAKTLLPE